MTSRPASEPAHALDAGPVRLAGLLAAGEVSATELATEALNRTLNMFRGVVSKTRG